jgi:hypothetical protein
MDDCCIVTAAAAEATAGAALASVAPADVSASLAAAAAVVAQASADAALAARVAYEKHRRRSGLFFLGGAIKADLSLEVKWRQASYWLAKWIGPVTPETFDVALFWLRPIMFDAVLASRYARHKPPPSWPCLISVSTFVPPPPLFILKTSPQGRHWG